jgi:hypothetical protein
MKCGAKNIPLNINTTVGHPAKKQQSKFRPTNENSILQITYHVINLIPLQVASFSSLPSIHWLTPSHKLEGYIHRFWSLHLIIFLGHSKSEKKKKY